MTEGPVLILAGAGTGKTRVIAHRIAALVQAHPNLNPENILALTFSRKASHEMLERVEGLLGAAADELGVFTFHGFCHRFIQDHAAQLGFPSRFQLFDRTESWIFFRRLLPDLRLSAYWNVADPTDCIEDFLRFISRAKDELVSPEEFAAHVQKSSDLQERAKGQEAGRAYRAFQKRMRQQGGLDFGDLIVETLRALQEKPALLARLQSKYRYILVDEFQDTNVAQIALLGLLAGKSGNLCVVGDDDQAIYRFRGASFASFFLMKKMFPRVVTVRLTQNYRSNPQILAAADRLIRHNEPDRYDPEKRLWTEKAQGLPVQAVVCRDEPDEAQKVIETIRSLKEEPASSVAVLYRAHHHKGRLVEALRGAGIPFVVHGGAALFDQEEIKDLVSFLQVLHDPSDSVHLFRILSHPMRGIPAVDLMAISRSAKERRIPLSEALRFVPDLPVSSSAKESVRQLLTEMEGLGPAAARTGMESLVSRIAEETSLRTVFRAGDPRLHLGRFLRFVCRAAQTHPGSHELDAFLWYLDSYQQAGGDPQDDEEEETAGDQVRLMTIHQAKGLEFDWVILLGMVQGRFPARGRPEAIPFPVELMKEPLPQGDYHLQEERRLCYVACTRARRGLFFMTQERLYHQPSLFVREVSQGAAPEEFQWRLDSRDPAGFSDRIRQVAEAAQERAAALPIPARFSYTQMETYRYCPMKYQYQYLYQIPVRPTPQMSFGIDLHGCLERFFRSIMEGQVPPLEKLLESFRETFAPGRYGEPYQEEEYRRLGMELLTAFYRRDEGHFTPPLFVERPFSLTLGDVGLHGVIDRVDPLPGGGIEIIDYKTGKPKKKADSGEQLQLTLYALACREVFHLEPRRTSFYFLRNGEKLSCEQKPETLEKAKAQVMERVQAIRSGDFTPAPSPMKCRFCDFRKLCPASMA